MAFGVASSLLGRVWGNSEPPSVGSETPAHGPYAGGTLLTITGDQLFNTTGVKVGGVPATNFRIVDGATITCRSPALTVAGTPTTVDVAVTNANGDTVLQGAFTYDPPPRVDIIAPLAGPIAGGQTITITGQYFLGANLVRLLDAVGGAYMDLSTFTVVSDVEITAVTLAHPVTGNVRAFVQTVNGTGSGGTYTFKSPVTLTSYSPKKGPLVGGTLLAFVGQGFNDLLDITFDGASGTELTLIDDFNVTVKTPVHGAGAVDVTLVAVGGDTTAAAGFTYRPAPTVSAIVPTSGPQGGGQSVVIYGTNFSDASTAAVGGGLAAMSFHIVSDTQITGVTAAHAPGLADVTASGPGGDALLAQAYSFIHIPVVTSIAPDHGPLSGGTPAILIGQYFSNATAVSIGGAAVTNFTVVSDTEIHLVAPPQAGSGLYSVEVIATGGTGDSTTGLYTYGDVPVITAVLPVDGPFAGNTRLAVSGRNFVYVTSVLIDGQPATDFDVSSPTSIIAHTPASNRTSTAAVDVTVISDYGTATAADAFTYRAAPTINMVQPNAGPVRGGTPIVITGYDFTNATAGQLGTGSMRVVLDSFTVINDTEAHATTEASPLGTLPLYVMGPGGTGMLAAAFTYVPVPVLGALSPNQGPYARPTAVTLAGQYFTTTSEVLVDGVSVPFTVANDGELDFQVPAGAAGPATIQVTNAGGSTSTTFQRRLPPTLTSVTPAVGATKGAVPVVLSGTNFIGTLSVSMGNDSFASYNIDSDMQITAYVPSEYAGTYDVTVVTGGGTATLMQAYEYKDARLDAVTPVYGPLAGGTGVSLTGQYFPDLTSLKIGDVSFTDISTSSEGDSVSATTPPMPAGSYDIVLITPKSGAALMQAFTYLNAPTISTVAPTKGPSAGSASVVITGQYFTHASAVSIGGPVASYTVDSDTQITAITMMHAVQALQTVTVTTPGGVATKTNAYSYVGPATITSITPSQGIIDGGTFVTILGTAFSDASLVALAGNPFTDYSVDSDTQITGHTPAATGGTPGAATLSIRTPGGTTTFAGWTYVVKPTVVSVSPSAGPTAGGTVLTVTGTAFRQSGLNVVTGVLVGGTNAGTITFLSDTQFQVNAPAHSAATVDLVLKTTAGDVTYANAYTFIAPPTATSIQRSKGSTAGGQQATIYGTNLATASLVTFDGVAATIVSMAAGFVVVTTPAHAASGAVNVVVTTAGGATSATGLQFTYGDPPTITSLTPNKGSTLGTTAVVIAGTSLGTTSSVTFDGVTAAITSLAAGNVGVTAPAHATGSVDVIVTTDFGTVTAAQAFTYQPLPTVTSVTPARGGTNKQNSVTILGTGLLGVTRVLLNASDIVAFQGSFIVQDDSTILAVFDDTAVGGGTMGTGTKDVTVVNPYDTGTLAAAYTFVPAPTVTSFTPADSFAAGGGTVTINGTNFLAPDVASFGVTLAGVAATNVTRVSDTQLTATVPAASVGTNGVVQVTTTGGTGASTALFYYDAVPTLTGTTPARGPLAGGTAFQAAGANHLQNGRSLVQSIVVGVPLTALSSTAAGTSGTTSANSAGTYDVVVTFIVPNPDGSPFQLTQSAAFTYLNQPVITSVTPSSGTSNGATPVTVAGQYLSYLTAASIGGAALTSLVPVDDSSFTGATAAHAAGAATASATTAGGTGNLASAFTYVAPPQPTLASIAPMAGPIAGMQPVTINGQYFTGATAVTFGGTVATNVVVVSDTQITATVPAHTQGNVVVAVTTTYGGTGSSASGFYYYAGVPSIASLAPARGVAAGSTQVTLTGTNFLNATSVTFGGLVATISTNTDTQLVVTTPAHAAGSVNVIVTTAGGSSAATPFLYGDPPTVTSLAPTTGNTAGGTSVTLTGTNLLYTTQVLFDGVAATINSQSATTVVVTTPAHAAAGVFAVQVTTDFGSVTKTGAFTYVAPPVITSVTPNTGGTNRQTSVVITGSGFAAGVSLIRLSLSSQTFDITQTQGSFVVVNDTTINAVFDNFTAGGATYGTGTATLLVTGPGGVGSLANAFTFTPVPTVTDFVPKAVLTSQMTPKSVVITGTGFTSATAVTLAGVAASSFSVDSSTQITAQAAPSSTARTGVVAVTVGGNAGTSAQTFAYFTATVTSASPSTLTAAGGQTVQVTGTGLFDNGLSYVSSVDIGGTPGTITGYAGDGTGFSFTAPAKAAGTYDLHVTLISGDVLTLANAFTYSNPASITSVSPNTGSSNGGQAVTFNGAYFTGATAASLGGSALTGISVRTDGTQLFGTTTGHAAGSTTASVTKPLGTTTLANAYTYAAPSAPVVTSISPSTGSTAGGQQVTLVGQYFTGTTGVTFGGTAATGIIIDSDTQLRLTIPAKAAGAYPAIVTTTYGGASSSTAVSGNTLTYYAPHTVTGFTPANAPLAGGTTVTVNGTNFVSGLMSATLNGTAVALTYVSATALTFVTPAYAMAGTVPFVLTGPATTTTNNFTYTNPNNPKTFTADFTQQPLGRQSNAGFQSAMGLSFARASTLAVLTSPTTMDDTLAANEPGIGNRTTTQSKRGLSINHARINLYMTISGAAANAARGLEYATSFSGTNGDTQTAAQADSPNPSASGSTRHQVIRNGSYYTNPSVLAVTPAAHSQFQKSTTSPKQLSAVNGAVSLGPATAVTRDAAAAWERVGLVLPNHYSAASNPQISFVEGRERSPYGGDLSMPRDVLVDFTQLEYGKWVSDVVLTTGTGAAPNDLPSIANGALIYSSDSQMKLRARFTPKFSSRSTVYVGAGTISTAFSLFNWSSTAKGAVTIAPLTGIVTMYANGAANSKVSATGMVWDQYDEVETYFAFGNSGTTRSVYRRNGGLFVDLAIASVVGFAVPTTTTPINICGDTATTGNANDYAALPSWLHDFDFYTAAGAPPVVTAAAFNTPQTQLTFTGFGFTAAGGVTGVLINGVAAANFGVSSDATLYFDVDSSITTINTIALQTPAGAANSGALSYSFRPQLTSLSQDIYDRRGGAGTLTLAGSFLHGTSTNPPTVYVNGVAGTTVSWTATQIVFQPPALPYAGVYNVTVTGLFGASIQTLKLEAWCELDIPETLALTDYATGTWAGSSALLNPTANAPYRAVQNTTSLQPGSTTVNGHAAAVFDGVDDNLTILDTTGAQVKASALLGQYNAAGAAASIQGIYFALVKPAALATAPAAGNFYKAPALFSAGPGIGLAITAGGATAYVEQNAGSWAEATATGVITTDFQLVVLEVTATTIRARRNGTWTGFVGWTPGTTQPVLETRNVNLGVSGDGTTFFSGAVLAEGFHRYAFSEGVGVGGGPAAKQFQDGLLYNKLQGAMRHRYGLTSTLYDGSAPVVTSGVVGYNNCATIPGSRSTCTLWGYGLANIDEIWAGSAGSPTAAQLDGLVILEQSATHITFTFYGTGTTFMLRNSRTNQTLQSPALQSISFDQTSYTPVITGIVDAASAPATAFAPASRYTMTGTQIYLYFGLVSVTAWTNGVKKPCVIESLTTTSCIFTTPADLDTTHKTTLEFIFNQFTLFWTPPPKVASLQDTSNNTITGGTTSGGNTVVVNGLNFGTISALTFAGSSLAFTWISETQISFVAPAHAAGTVTFTITNQSGVSAAYPYIYA